MQKQYKFYIICHVCSLTLTEDLYCVHAHVHVHVHVHVHTTCISTKTAQQLLRP